MNSRSVNPLSSRQITSPSRATNQGITATSSTSRRLYTAASSTLGGSASAADAREAQERANKAQVAVHEEKLKAKRMKQLEEKMAKYSFLIGNTLGKSDGLTMQQVREMQEQEYSQIAANNTLKLRGTQDESRKSPVKLHQDSPPEVAKSLREIRIQQQENYNAAMEKKSSS